MKEYVEVLNFTIDLEELKNAYKQLSDNSLRWTFSGQKDQLHPITVQKYNGYNYDGLPYGWALTSPYDTDTVASPWAITNFAPGTSNRPTKLLTGIFKKVYDLMPDSAFEFSLTVHPPGAEIVKHSDGDNTLRIHIPIQNTTHFIIDDNGEKEHTLKANGNAYLIDVRYQHRTINPTNNDRVSFIIGIPVDAEDAVRSITGFVK